MVGIEGNFGALLQFVGLSTIVTSIVLLLIWCTGIQTKCTNSKKIKKIHNVVNRKTKQNEKIWFFDVGGKIA